MKMRVGLKVWSDTGLGCGDGNWSVCLLQGNASDWGGFVRMSGVCWIKSEFPKGGRPDQRHKYGALMPSGAS